MPVERGPGRWSQLLPTAEVDNAFAGEDTMIGLGVADSIVEALAQRQLSCRVARNLLLLKM